MEKYNEADGVWRTIGGRRVFIKKGQSLSEAMIESGKFKNDARTAYRKAKEDLENFKKKKEEKESTKENDELKKKTIHTQSGDYTADELKQRDEEIKQLYKDTWEGKNSYKDLHDKLEEMKKDGKVSQGELNSLQSDASMETKSKEDKERLEIAKDIAKEVYGKNMGDELLERKAKEILEPQDGEVLEKDDKPYTNAKGELERSTQYLKQWRDDLKKTSENEKETKDNESFTQHTDMHSGTIEYSKEQLDKMADNGVKPMEHSYTGGGWEGTKYDSNLSTKDIAKNINDYAKKEFPDVKLSRNTDYNGIDIHVMSSGKDLYISASDIDKMSDKQVSDTIRDSIGGYTRMDDWLNANNRKNANGTFTVKDKRDYLKEQLNTYKSRKGDNVSGNEWYLSDYGKKVISGLNKEMNSYNYDDSDGMVDYFNTNFYGYVKIGKWDKPYEVKESKSGNQITNSLQMKAYEKYKREHPSSTMTYDQFRNKK